MPLSHFINVNIRKFTEINMLIKPFSMIAENINSDSRSCFNETWLTEMPSGLGSFETFDQINFTIKERISLGSSVERSSNGLCKIVGNTILLYWIENKQDIVIGVELERKQQGLVISVTGKNPKYRGRAPFASDLYDMILKDSKTPIRIFSDIQLSDEGYGIWKKLFALGHTISVYDRDAPGQSYRIIKSANEMDSFFKNDDTDYQRYQFVLSESTDVLSELTGFFHIRRYRELSAIANTGMLLK